MVIYQLHISFKSPQLSSALPFWRKYRYMNTAGSLYSFNQNKNVHVSIREHPVKAFRPGVRPPTDCHRFNQKRWWWVARTVAFSELEIRNFEFGLCKKSDLVKIYVKILSALLKISGKSVKKHAFIATGNSRLSLRLAHLFQARLFAHQQIWSVQFLYPLRIFRPFLSFSILILTRLW